MEEQLPELVLPDPFSILTKSDSPSTYFRILGAIGTVVAGGVCLGAWRRHQRLRRLRDHHEKRVEQWFKEKDAERNDRIAFLRQTGELIEDQLPPLQITLDETMELWKEAHRLGCANAKQLKMLVVQELQKEVPSCLERSDRGDWRSERRLATVVDWVKNMGVHQEIGPSWITALNKNRHLLNRNRIQLFVIMIMSSKFRVLGLGLTSVVAFVSERLESAIADTYTQWMECFIHYAPHATILKWATVNLALCALSASIQFGVEKLSAKMLAGFKKETDTRLYQALANMDMEFFDTYTDKEVNEIADLTSELLEADSKLHSNVKHVIRIVSKVTCLLRINPRMTVSLFGLCGLYSVVNYGVDKFTSLSGEVEPVEEAPNNQAIPMGMHMDLYTVMQNIKVLRAFSCERQIIQSILAKQGSKNDDENASHNTWISALVDCTGTWALSGIRLWGVWHAAWLVQRKLLDYPTAQLNNLATQAFVAFQEIQMLEIKWIDEYAADANLLLQVLQYRPKIEKDDGIVKPGLIGTVEFRDVYFAYPLAPDIPVLRGLSFTAEPGQLTGLVGQSGGGKSTTMQLLQRLYDTTGGSILIDNIDIKEYNPRWLRTQIAVVSQNVQLFDMSIEDNIRLANSSATREEVLDAARRARAYEFIMRLPSGFSTYLSACQLSGGQRQRIAIARALLMRAKILLLDEATSALDTVAEKEVQLALNDAMKGKTCIMVTHRLVTVRNAHKIVVIHKGVCAQQGTHCQLVRQRGVYADLVDAAPTSPQKPQQFDSTPHSAATPATCQQPSPPLPPQQTEKLPSPELGPILEKPIPLKAGLPRIASGDKAKPKLTLPNIQNLDFSAEAEEQLLVAGPEEGARLQNRSHTVDIATVVAFGREFHGYARRLHDLQIHNNCLEYNREVRCAIEKIITGMQDAVQRMGKHVKQSSCSSSAAAAVAGAASPLPAGSKRRNCAQLPTTATCPLGKPIPGAPSLSEPISPSSIGSFSYGMGFGV